MAGVRDPAFWKRFSTAVHLDEETGTISSGASSSSSTKADMKHQDSWLAKQNKKKRKRTCLCWCFWFGFLAVIAIVVVLVLWLLKAGYFAKLEDKIESL